jgi:glycosyltransferase involved in cell wall biosynthesis
LLIWLLQTGEPLPLEPGVRKMRTAMLADHLVSRGHEVRWWVNGFEHPKKKWMVRQAGELEVGPGLKLQVLLGKTYRKNISVGRYLGNRAIARQFRALAPTLKQPDLILASLPCHHLAAAAMDFATEYSIPSVVDVRDLWPESFTRVFPHPWLRKIGKSMLAGEFHQARSALRQADSVVAVSHGFLDWAQTLGDRKDMTGDRVFYLGCSRRTPQAIESVVREAGGDCSEDVPQRKFTAVFLGTWGTSYELPLILEAAARLQSRGRSDIRFVLAGDGLQGPEIRRRSETLDNVELPGWLDKWAIDGMLADADVGLSPIKTVSGTFPNKIFEYFSASLPVISSLEGEVGTLIAERNLGLNYLPGDVEGLCRALETLADEPDRRRTMGVNALEFFVNNGDAQMIYSEFSDWLEEKATGNRTMAANGSRG